MDNYKLQIAESMIKMLDKAVQNKDEKIAKQIISKYFKDPKMMNRFLNALFSGKEEKITIKEGVYNMLDGNPMYLIEKFEKGEKPDFSKKKDDDDDSEDDDDDKKKDMKEEAKTGDKEAYQKFYKSVLKKFGVEKPDELEGDKKKEFYDFIDANWEGDNEED